jgi:hypothetical protein
MRNLNFLLLLFLLAFSCCQSQRKRSNDAALYFKPGIVQGILDKKFIDEASGLVASRVNPGMLWTHNDSGDQARIFLIDSLGQFQSTIWLTGALNRDWEDIAAGPGPEDGVSYLYIGDIGDNKAQYSYKTIYRIREPIVTEKKQYITEIDSIRFTLPDKVRDTEALMIDPHTRDLFIFSKREQAINLYRLPYPQLTGEVMEAELVMRELPFTSIVAADWSADGEEILIKNYQYVYYWKRTKNKPLIALLNNPPVELNYVEEPQGESIAFDLKGKGFYTLSEQSKKKTPELIFYPRAEGQ